MVAKTKLDQVGTAHTHIYQLISQSFYSLFLGPSRPIRLEAKL